ncbi:glycosyltransferase [Alicyclobacillus fructus]|uniref:glycosyltransferase n=1 Tax=Alicyclobacillus fructus TaxID=2816082 RepID=UPI001F2F04B0|nr:glycosyltransferase [Alicyclobacillus fructus]
MVPYDEPSGGKPRTPSVVLVHDYLNQRGGAEKVMAHLHRVFPEAPIYTSLWEPGKCWPSLQNAPVRASWMQALPFVRRKFKWFFWLYPFAFRTMRLPDCDVVLSSSSAYAKGVKLPGSQPLHICYCHTPMRFAWNFDAYIREEPGPRLLKRLARWLVPWLRRWDVRTARDVDVFIANSRTVRERIRRVYQRDAVIIHPPVELPPMLDREQEPFFLVVSRLVSYKRIDLAVEACTRHNWPLVVIGDGPDRKRLEEMAGPTVKFLGFQPEEVKQDYLARCKAFIFPGEEDFGISPVEAHAQGKPVVAYRAGGALDTIIEGVNGLFFTSPDPEDLANALRQLDGYRWDRAQIRATAERFSVERFHEAIQQVVFDAYRQRSATLPARRFIIQDSGTEALS